MTSVCAAREAATHAHSFQEAPPTQVHAAVAARGKRPRPAHYMRKMVWLQLQTGKTRAERHKAAIFSNNHLLFPGCSEKGLSKGKKETAEGKHTGEAKFQGHSIITTNRTVTPSGCGHGLIPVILPEDLVTSQKSNCGRNK